MNKKLFIFMFLVMASPVFASDTPLKDEVVIEKEPVIEEVQVEKQSFVQKVKDIFSKDEQLKPEAGEEADVAKPDTKTIETVQKEQKKQAKELQKQQKEAEKAAIKAQKEAEKAAELAQKEAEKQAKTAQKLAEKEAKEAQKLAEKQAKEAKKAVNEVVLVDENKVVEETQAVNEEVVKEEQTTLTNTAYEGSVETTKIMEVDECVKIALEKHPLIQSAMSNAEIYKSKIAQAWSNFFPTFSAGVSYSRNDMQVANFAFPIQEYDMFYVPTISGNMLLFDFGKTKAIADMAKRTHEASEFQLQNSINNVIFTVKQAYYNLLFAQQQVKVYEDTVADYTLHLEQAKAYYDIGTKAKIDVLTAEHNLGKAKLGLLQANNTLRIAYVQLSNAMGTPEVSDYDVKDNLKMKAYNIDVDNAVKTAYETSPQLLAAKKKADASGLLVRASVRAFTPNISGFGGYTRGGKRVDTDYGYQVGAQITYSNVNLMLLKKQVDEAKASHKKDVADYENAKQSIYFETKQAYLNLTNAQESIVVAKLSMDQAKEQYDQASGRYKVGLGTAIELKDAETTYRNAQLEYYSNLLNYHVSAANLEKVMGTPLQSTDTDLL